MTYINNAFHVATQRMRRKLHIALGLPLRTLRVYKKYTYTVMYNMNEVCARKKFEQKAMASKET